MSGTPDRDGTPRRTLSIKIGWPAVLLFYIFMTLRLTGAVDWPWMWVASPIWMFFALAFVVAAVAEVASRG